jgi:tRNA nucleotidyltransferase (CCA-adding enzyme)
MDQKIDDIFGKLEKEELLENLVTIKFVHKKRSVDVLWGQLKRSLAHLINQFYTYNFNVIRATCASDGIEESAFVFLMEYMEYTPSGWADCSNY